MNRWLTALGVFFVVIVNSLFGAGGGMLSVPLLQKSNLTQTQAHASSIAVIFPLSLLSSVLYVTSGKVALMQAVPYFPVAVIGAIAGSLLLPRIPAKWLRRIFGIFMLWAGIRMVMR